MTKFQNILFDLDGTLTDSGPGITRSAQYALGKLGIDEPDLVRLRTFVGPPLSDSFVRQYHLTTAETAKAVAYFRERYTVTGVYENALYPGIAQMLKDLKAAGRHLAVASSKPEPLVLTVLQHFKVMPYFDVVCGADPAREEDGVARGSDKDIVVRRALSLLGERIPLRCAERKRRWWVTAVMTSTARMPTVSRRSASPTAMEAGRS